MKHLKSMTHSPRRAEEEIPASQWFSILAVLINAIEPLIAYKTGGDPDLA